MLVNKPELRPAQLERTRTMMNQAIPDSLITGYEALIDTLELPDVDDRHVLAAAIHSQAQAIVTFNLKDFPKASLEPFGVEALHPDQFVADQIRLHAPMVIQAVRATRQRLRQPPREALEHLERIRDQGLPRVAALLEPYLELL